MTLRSCSFATVRRTKKLTDLGNSLALGLQCGVNNISLQCILWPISKVPVWPNFDVRFWGQMTPKVKIFENIFPDSATEHRTTFRNQMWWNRPLRSSRKVAWFTKQKKLELRGTRPSPHFGQNGLIAPKILWTNLTCPRTPNLVRIGCVLPDLFRKDCFFRPKKSIHYRLSVYNEHLSKSNKNYFAKYHISLSDVLHILISALAVCISTGESTRFIIK